MLYSIYLEDVRIYECMVASLWMKKTFINIGKVRNYLCEYIILLDTNVFICSQTNGNNVIDFMLFLKVSFIIHKFFLWFLGNKIWLNSSMYWLQEVRKGLQVCSLQKTKTTQGSRGRRLTPWIFQVAYSRQRGEGQRELP